MLVWSCFTRVWAVVAGEAPAYVESRRVVGAVEAFGAWDGICGSSRAILTRNADSTLFLRDGVWTLRFCTAFADKAFVTD